MFSRPRHQAIAKLLQTFNATLLSEAGCFFGGGTAIVLKLGEYRESLDIDFMFSSKDGYRLLRNAVTDRSLGSLVTGPVEYRREVTANQYGVRTVIQVDEFPIKVEFVRESRIELSGYLDKTWGVPVLDTDDMYVEKLLANADRGLDKSVLSRDLIDLAMMVSSWGPIPDKAWDRAKQAYGEHVVTQFQRTRGMVADSPYLQACLVKMEMAPHLIGRIRTALNLPKEEGSDCKAKPSCDGTPSVGL